MNKYAHDDLLAAHFEKVAIFATIARTLAPTLMSAGARAAAPAAAKAGAKAAPGFFRGVANAMGNQGFGGTLSNLGRGFLGFGAKTVGKGREAGQAARTLHGLGSNASTAMNAVNTVSSLMPSSPTPSPPAQNNSNGQF